jgi:hypothetical protein
MRGYPVNGGNREEKADGGRLQMNKGTAALRQEWTGATRFAAGLLAGLND